MTLLEEPFKFSCYSQAKSMSTQTWMFENSFVVGQLALKIYLSKYYK